VEGLAALRVCVVLRRLATVVFPVAAHDPHSPDQVRIDRGRIIREGEVRELASEGAAKHGPTLRVGIEEKSHGSILRRREWRGSPDGAILADGAPVSCRMRWRFGGLFRVAAVLKCILPRHLVYAAINRSLGASPKDHHSTSVWC
jgi:hypothetical protein